MKKTTFIFLQKKKLKTHQPSLRKTLFLMFFLFANFANYAFAANNLKVTENTQPEIIKINFNSQKGLELLESSLFKNDFFQLVNFFEPQINPLYCGVASAISVINALNYGNIPQNSNLAVNKPTEMGGGVMDFQLYSQQFFLNEETDKIKNKMVIDLKLPKETKDDKPIYDPGFNLEDLASILQKVYQLTVEKFEVGTNSTVQKKQFRNLVKNIFAEKSKFIIANFSGKAIKNNVGGHFSPIVAYNQNDDLILVMDVALHKHQWYWISLEQFYDAMNTKDGNNFRGFLIVSKNK